jgi:2-(1,2-epoxy-1,2-dihydrophenyl)acetyl-CoA isomerase
MTNDQCFEIQLNTQHSTLNTKNLKLSTFTHLIFMDFILKNLQNNILTITLNRPEKFNSFTEPMALELQGALKEAESKEIRCVVLNANGKAFCGGQDLPEVIGREKDPSYKLEDTVASSYNPIIRQIRQLKKPVVCAVQGTAAGAGANIAFACDIILASNQALFVQAFSKIGLIPDSGGTWFLPRLIGIARSNALYMLDEKITAEQAVELGLIYKSVNSDQLTNEVHNISAHLASMPTTGFALYKEAINKSFNNSLEQQLALEASLQTIAGKSDDYKEGVTAFLEKRKAVFKGN